MSLYRDEGVVLRTYRLGEADRIVMLLTEHHGKVRAVAKGVRRTASKFGGRVSSRSATSRCLCWQGRGELDIVNQAEVTDHFRTGARGPRPGGQGVLRARGGRPARPGAPRRSRLYDMLVGALRAARRPTARPRLVPPPSS